MSNIPNIPDDNTTVESEQVIEQQVAPSDEGWVEIFPTDPCAEEDEDFDEDFDEDGYYPC